VLESKVKTLPFMTGASARAFTRLLFSGAVECDMDKQGRILLPDMLRSYAGIEKNLVIAGVSSHMEIWSEGRWQEYMKNQTRVFEKTVEQLMDFGI